MTFSELTLETLLTTQDASNLRTILLKLVANHPGLKSEVFLLAGQSVTTTLILPTDTPLPLPIDQALIRKRLQDLTRGSRHSHSRYDDYDDEEDNEMQALIDDVSTILEEAKEAVQWGDGNNALIILEALTEEYYQAWSKMDDWSEAGSEYFDEIGVVWTEAVLTAEWTPEAQRVWKAKLEELQDSASGLHPALLALEQGWDYPPLVRILQGDIPEMEAEEEASSVEEGASPYAKYVTTARLNILEREERFQEAAFLAKAEKLSNRYLHFLVKLGQIEAAVEAGKASLSFATQALVLAKDIHEFGNFSAALQVAKHGLTLEGGSIEMATWTRDVARQQGDTALVRKALRILLQTAPSLADYQALQFLSGEDWPAQKEEILDSFRTTRTYLRSGVADIFLHEKLWAEALATIQDVWDYDLQVRVVEVVLPYLPNEVIPHCKHQAEVIMNGGKADRYHYAADWVRRMRDAYRATGREAEWQTYKAELLSLHQRKYKLIPLLKPL